MGEGKRVRGSRWDRRNDEDFVWSGYYRSPVNDKDDGLCQRGLLVFWMKEWGKWSYNGITLERTDGINFNKIIVGWRLHMWGTGRVKGKRSIINSRKLWHKMNRTNKDRRGWPRIREVSVPMKKSGDKWRLRDPEPCHGPCVIRAFTWLMYEVRRERVYNPDMEVVLSKRTDEGKVRLTFILPSQDWTPQTWTSLRFYLTIFGEL